MASDVRAELNFLQALLFSGSAGASGQMMISSGPGSPPQWGRKITVGTVAPSSPAVNDIWIDTN